MLFDRSVPDARVCGVFSHLGLDEWLSTLPAGLDTPLGGAGRGLSAGEAQLVALARVFLKDPGLVVLDEASSRLDPHTERLLERAVTRFTAGGATEWRSVWLVPALGCATAFAVKAFAGSSPSDFFISLRTLRSLMIVA